MIERKIKKKQEKQETIKQKNWKVIGLKVT